MTNLKGSHPNNKSKNKNNNLAFSLIELSIVLIIIGLLVAGVTGGKSLIDSARARAFINEIRDAERALWTYKAAKGRYPGDVMDYGTIGYYSNYYKNSSAAQPYYAYQKTDFAPPFDTGDFIPNHISAPFVDLYTEGIIDFKPLGNTITSDKNSTTKGTPTSRVFNNVYYYFYHSGSLLGYQQAPAQDKTYLTGIANEGSIQNFIDFVYSEFNATNGFDPKILKSVDQKLDDGEHWNGKMRTACYGKKADGTDSDTTLGYTDYDYAIENGKKCRFVYYAL